MTVLSVNTVFPEILPNLASGLILLLMHGLLASCELSLFKLRYARLPEDWRAVLEQLPSLAPLLRETERAMRAIRFGQAATLVCLGILWVPLLANEFAYLETAWFGSPKVLSWFVAIFLVLMLHHIIGEVLPRALGLAYPVAILRLSGALLVVFEWLTRPFHGGVHRMSRLIWRVTTRNRKWPSLDALGFEAQLEAFGEQDSGQVLKQIVRNAVRLRELEVSDVLLPRNQVKYFNLRESVQDNLKMARETGHTRFPLCLGDLDHCIGLIHIKDLFRYTGDLDRIDLRKIRRDIIRIGLDEPLERALSKLLVHKMHMALVIDEFRGTEGVLTLERILEQLVGEIQDEFDQEEEVLIRAVQADGTALVSGLTPIHDLETAFEVEIKNEAVSTLGGLITSEIGRIPEKGEVLEVEGLVVTVTEVDDTRVIEARVRRLDPNNVTASDTDDSQTAD